MLNKNYITIRISKKEKEFMKHNNYFTDESEIICKILYRLKREIIFVDNWSEKHIGKGK